MATFNKVNNFLLALGKAEMNFTSDTVRVALYTAGASTWLTATQAVGYTTTNEATGGGYTAAGQAVTTPSWTLNGGTVEYSSVEPTTWTATGGAADILFRYVVYYDDTATANCIIGFYDYGSTVTLSTAASDTFTVTPASAKLFTIA